MKWDGESSTSEVNDRSRWFSSRMSRFGYFPFNRESLLHDLWDSPLRRRLFHQKFGVGLNDGWYTDDDFVPYSLFDKYYSRTQRSESRQETSGMSDNQTNGSKFKVLLDVSHFAPDEINVKTVDNYVVVHAKHEERPDEHGLVSREFQRRYLLPEDVVPESITSSLSRSGILYIEGPRNKPDATNANERVIKIVQMEENVEAGPSTSQDKK